VTGVQTCALPISVYGWLLINNNITHGQHKTLRFVTKCLFRAVNIIDSNTVFIHENLS
jgi:hypothetical protein